MFHVKHLIFRRCIYIMSIYVLKNQVFIEMFHVKKCIINKLNLYKEKCYEF